MAISGVGMANLGFWGCLPMGISNYGGDIQVYNVPSYANRNIFLGFNTMGLYNLSASFYGMPTSVPHAPLWSLGMSNMGFYV